MAKKPTYEELEQRIKELEKAAVEHRHIEKKRQEAEARHKGIFNYTKNGVAVYRASDEGKDFIFVDFNKASEKIDNIKKEEVIGKTVTKVFPGVVDFGLLEVFQRVYKTGKPEHYPIAMYKDERIFGWRDNYVYKLPTGEIVAVYSDETQQKQAEEALKLREKELKNQAQSLDEANTALKVLLKHMEQDKAELEEKIITNVKELIFPYIQRLEKTDLDNNQTSLLQIVQSNLDKIVSPFLRQLSSKYLNLTPMEIRVADLIKEGKTTKEIAQILKSSTGAVNFHRNNLRKKLGLLHKKANLRTYLLSLT